jgi:hypothetical protein
MSRKLFTPFSSLFLLFSNSLPTADYCTVSHGFPADDAKGLMPMDRDGFGIQGARDPTFPVQGDKPHKRSLITIGAGSHLKD